MVHINNITILISNYFANLHSIIKYGILFGVTVPTVGKYSLYKRKSSDLWLMHNPEVHVEVCYIILEILLVPSQYILSVMTFIVSNEEYFQTYPSIRSINTWNKHHYH
jgi:hypothetical protein